MVVEPPLAALLVVSLEKRRGRPDKGGKYGKGLYAGECHGG